MANWWEMSAGEIAKDPDAQKQRHDAYWATFMKEPTGRQVSADLRRALNVVPDLKGTVGEQSVCYLGQLRALALIRRNCGIDTELPAIQGEANASQIFKMPEPMPQFDAAGALYDEHKRKKETD